MAQFIVRNLEDDVRDRLRDLAREQGQSMEEMVRDILRNAVLKQSASPKGLGTRLTERFAENPLEADIPELRGQQIEPMSFDQ